MEEIIEKWALYNAVKYNGKANLNAVVPKIIAEKPEIRKEIKQLIPKIKEIIDKINSLSLEEQKEKFLDILIKEGFLRLEEKDFVKTFRDVILEKNKVTFKFEGFSIEIIKEEKRKIIVSPKEKEEEVLKYFKEVEIAEKREERILPPLPKAEKGKVKTRFAPNPSGYLHIGHARAIVLNYIYAKMYDGKFVLRLEDTDPKVKRPILDAYEKIKEDVEWLIEDKIDEFYIQSERLEIYYEYARKLIEMGKAYVDLCPQERISELRKKGEYCEHREKPIEWQLEQWEKMLNGEYDEGQAVLRIKTDLHPNPSVRDWIAFRIVNPEKHPHPWLEYKYGENYAKKFWVWPTYNFAVAIDDHLMGITHIFRMKEHEINTIKQSYIYKYFNWEEPIVINYGAFIVKDMPLHKSEIRKLIEEGKIEGWCDPFLPTLCGLRRRGIHPEAIKKYIIEVGANPVDVVVSFEKIYKYNREIYDKKAKRFFFIEEPILVRVEGLQRKEFRIPYHPDVDLGYREFKIKEPYVYLDKNDLENKYLRLMEGFNIEIIKKNGEVIARYIDDSLETARKLKAKIVQWVPKEYAIEIKVWNPERKIKGIGEKYLENVKENEVVHFIRYGFLKKEKDYFIYMHK